MGSTNLVYIVPKLAKAWYIELHRKYCEIKRSVTFERLVD